MRAERKHTSAQRSVQLAEEGHDIEEMQAHIHAIVVKTLLAVQARSPVAPTAWASLQCARGCLRRPIVRTRLCVAECCFWVHRFLALCCTQRFEISFTRTHCALRPSCLQPQ